MAAFCSFLWFVSLIAFIVYFFKKRNARKAAGENYQENEKYLQVSKRKKIIGWVCLAAFIGAIAFPSPESKKPELTPEQIAQQQEAKAKKEEEKKQKEAEKAQKEAEEKAKKEEAERQKAEEEAKKKAAENTPEAICEKALGGYFGKVEVMDSKAGMIIHVYFAADTNNYSGNDRILNDVETLKRYSMEKQVNRVMEALYASGLPIASVTTHSQGETKDSAGNIRKNDDWLRCTVNADTGARLTKNKDWEANGTFRCVDDRWEINGL